MSNYTDEMFDNLPKESLIDFFENMAINSSYTKNVKKAFLLKLKCLNDFEFSRLKATFLWSILRSKMNIELDTKENVNIQFMGFLFGKFF
jgi:hypothetical protein